MPPKTDKAPQRAAAKRTKAEGSKGTVSKRARSKADAKRAEKKDVVAKRSRKKDVVATDNAVDGVQQDGTRETLSGKDRKRNGAQRRQEKTMQVIVELERLRAELDAMAESYRLRVGGQVAELLRYVHGDPALAQKPRPFTIRAADAMLDAISDAELKPKKGRAKDFARMQELVAALSELAPTED